MKDTASLQTGRQHDRSEIAERGGREYGSGSPQDQWQPATRYGRHWVHRRHEPGERQISTRPLGPTRRWSTGKLCQERLARPDNANGPFGLSGVPRPAIAGYEFDTKSLSCALSFSMALLAAVVIAWLRYLPRGRTPRRIPYIIRTQASPPW